MKGCLGVLALLVVLAIGEYALLYWTPLAGSFGLPILSAVLIALVVLNVWGLVVWFQRRAAIGKPAQNWRDGELVGASGRILSDQRSIPAPASQVACAIYHYTVSQRRTHTVRSGGSTRTESRNVTIFEGHGMSGCSVQAGVQRYRLIGFPILNHVPTERLDEGDVYQRMAAHLLRAAIRPKATGVKDAIGSLKELLTDADGVVHLDEECEGEFDLAPFRARFATDPAGAEQELAEHFESNDYWIDEQRVPEASEVTVFGKYDAKARTIDVGNALDNIQHSLSLGAAGTVLGSDLRRSLIALAIFGAAAWFFHAWVGPPVVKSLQAQRYEGDGITFEHVLGAKFGPQSEQTSDKLVSLAQAREAGAIRLLTALGADPNGQPDDTSPVRQAGDAATLRALMDAGADPNVKDHNGNTPLHDFTERGDLDTVRLLLERGARPDAINNYASTALTRAATYGHLEIARALLDAGANPNVRSRDGSTPLDEARANGHGDVEQLLLEREAAETEVTARNGVAITRGHPGVRLIDAYLDAVKSHDADTIIPLYTRAAGAKLDFSDIDWDAFSTGRPARAHAAAGFATDERATIRVTEPGAYPLGFELERLADAPPDDPNAGWRIARTWIQWDR